MAQWSALLIPYLSISAAVIRAGVSEEVANSSLFRVVDTEDD